MRAGLLALAVAALSCTDDPVTPLDDADAGAVSADAEPEADAAEKPDDSGTSRDADAVEPDATIVDMDGGALPDAEPNDGGPVFALPPPLRPYSAGACPTLVFGSTATTSVNTGFVSAGNTRKFRLM